MQISKEYFVFTKNRMHMTHTPLAPASMNNEIEPAHPHRLEDTESCLSPADHRIRCILKNNNFLYVSEILI